MIHWNTWNLMKLYRSSSALLEPINNFMICSMPGPPWDSYLMDDGIPNTWQISSWGKRSKPALSFVQRRSNRSTAKALRLSVLIILTLGTANPSALASSMQRYSFSTLSLRSSVALACGISPIGSLIMWVVGVFPFGIHHCPSMNKSAVFFLEHLPLRS